MVELDCGADVSVVGVAVGRLRTIVEGLLDIDDVAHELRVHEKVAHNEDEHEDEPVCMCVRAYVCICMWVPTSMPIVELVDVTVSCQSWLALLVIVIVRRL